MAGIYTHIPFCKSRCIYCDFYSTTLSQWKDRYISALCRELEDRKSYINEPVETIYFGGGTPSQLDPVDFERIFKTIDRVYGMNRVKEITLEANPDDLNPDYIQALSELPFNRISIGIQTFDDKLLKLLNRRHNSAQAIQAVIDCRKAGFDNISIDLMYGLPSESISTWKNDLDVAIRLNPEHISAYHLTYESGTVLEKFRSENLLTEITEDESIDFFILLIDRLKTSGYEHYEISNFCKPGLYSLHNTSYWKGIPYLGCGASAHSFNGSTREWNVSSISKYVEGIECGNRNYDSESLDSNTRYNDLIITSLRTKWGLSLLKIRDLFGSTFISYCREMSAPYLANGYLIETDNTLILTNEGLFISDRIMSDLMRVDN